MSRTSKNQDLRGIEVRGDNSFRVRINRKGVKRVQTFDDHEEAVRWRDRMYREIDGDATDDQQEAGRKLAKSTPLRVVLERYSREVTPTKKGHKQEAIRIRMWMNQPWADLPIASITRRHVREWRDERDAAGKAPSTISNALNVLSAAFRHAKSEWDIETGNPVQGMKRPPQRQARAAPPNDRLEKSLVERAARGAGPWMSPFITVAAWTAMRSSEIAGLRWRQVDLDKHFIHLPETKNGDARDVTLLPKAEDALRRWKAETDGDDNDWVFPSARRHDHRMAFNTPTVAFAAIMRDVAAQHPDARRVTFHDLRHWACTRLAPFHRDALHLSRTTGHKDVNTLRRYFNPSAAENAAEIRARAAKLAAEAMGAAE